MSIMRDVSTSTSQWMVGPSQGCSHFPVSSVAHLFLLGTQGNTCPMRHMVESLAFQAG